MLHTQFFAAERAGVVFFRWCSLVRVSTDAILTDAVLSTGGDDRVPQHLLTHSTPGLILGQIRPLFAAPTTSRRRRRVSDSLKETTYFNF